MSGGYMTSALNAPACAESYSAAWDRAHERLAAEDEERRALLDAQIRRDAETHRAGGVPRKHYRPHCECGRPVYCRGLCRTCYDAERKARGE